MPTTVLWLRRDLRLHDLPALGAAAEQADGGRVVPLFVLEPRLLGQSPVRTAALVQALASVRESYDGALVLRTGRAEEVLPAVVRETGAAAVHVSGETTPWGRRRDERVRAALDGVPLVATGSPYAVGPGLVLNGQGAAYQVFSPFARAWRGHGWPDPATVPAGVRWHRQVEGEELPAAPALPDATTLPEVGEMAARVRWEAFRDSALEDYGQARDRPDLDGTSRLSVQLKWGTIHPRTLLADLERRTGEGVRRFVDELAWREFYADVLWHHPASAWRDLKPALRGMAYDDPGTDDGVADLVRAWQEGRTGYPLVDAGMRQLLSEGWMHNRVRMVTASFLVKHLHVWWPHGARHFLRHLADGDIASNNHGWQWVAGTGTDAAPYFRVFNPVSQGLRYDPDGAYVRRHVPELRHLPGASAHEPWKASEGHAHGYPEPVVEHREARAEALRRYEEARAR